MVDASEPCLNKKEKELAGKFLIRWREALAYKRMAKGEFWIIDDKQDPAFLKKLSTNNLKSLHNYFKETPLQPEEENFLKAFYSAPVSLTHYTSELRLEKIMEAGYLFSSEALYHRGKKHLSSYGQQDMEIANQDFTFFRYELGNSEICKSRFGSHWLSLDGSDSSFSSVGWVSLFDQVYPFESGRVSSLRERMNHILHYEQTNKHRSFKNEELVFYGNDIKQGIGLSLVKEMRYLGNEYAHKRLLKLDTKSLAKTLSDVFRVEAKIPFRVNVKEAIEACRARTSLVGKPSQSGRLNSVRRALIAMFDFDF